MTTSPIDWRKWSEIGWRLAVFIIAIGILVIGTTRTVLPFPLRTHSCSEVYFRSSG